MKKIPLIFTILFSVIIQISCSSGNKIKGHVLDKQNNPLKNAEVKFATYKYEKTGISGGLKATSITNEKGEFEILVEKPPKDEKLGLVVVKQGYKQEIVNFTVEELRKFDEVFRDYNIFLAKDE